MDVADLLSETPDAGRWYKVPGSKAEVLIREIKPKRLKEIRKAHTEKRLIRDKYVEKPDEDAITEAMLDEAVRDWKNIEKDGEKYPVTLDSKKILDDEWSAFHHLWLGVVVRQTEVDGAILDAEEKN